MDTRIKIVGTGDIRAVSGRVQIAKGWFDVLSSEHGRLLGRAKAEGGALVVLVYEDSAGRPAPMTASDRAQMVAALECVDLVCICDASRSESVIAEVGPEAVTDVDAEQQRDLVHDVLERCERV